MNTKSTRNIYTVISLLLLSLVCFSAGAQSISQTRRTLEEQRNQLLQDIEQVSRDLEKVQSSRNRTMTQLRVLQNKLNLRNKLIRNIHSEIAYINDDIEEADEDIEDLQEQLDTLRAEYAKMVVYAYKNRNSYNTLYFILSANSFNDAIKRFQYLKQYREYREHEAKNIIKTQGRLKRKLDTLKEMKTKRSYALAAAKEQRGNVIAEKELKDSIAQTLKGHEKELLASIEAKKKESREISRKIAAIIRQQIEEARRKAAEEARRRAIEQARQQALAKKNAPDEGSTEEKKEEAAADVAPAPAATPDRPSNILEATPEAKALSQSFEANRGKLPWPVSHAIVVGTFGVHRHPVLSKVTVDNDGITLQTNQGSVVKAVFKGEVVAVRPISGRWLVVIRHGKYFTVYSNLKAATVSRGDQVGTLQPIGLTYTNPVTGETDLGFKVYRSTQPVDPLAWLAGR